MLSSPYKDEITYWGTPTPDGYGGLAFAAPILIKGRWEERAEQVMSPTGELITSKVVAYVLQDLQMGGFLALGDLTDVTNPDADDDSYAIRAWAKIPSLRRMEYERRAYL